MFRRVLPATYMCIGIGLAFVLQVAIARMLGSGEAFGRYAFYRSLALVIALVATLGIPMVLMRQIAARRTRDDQAEALSREVRDGFTLQVIATLTLGAISAFVIYRFVPSSETTLAAACLAVGLANAWVMTGERVARGLRRFALSQGVFRVGCPGLALAIALAWWVVSGGLTVYQALAATAAAYLVAAAVLLACGVSSLRTARDSGVGIAAAQSDPFASRLRRLLATSLPMLVISGLSLLMSQLDVLMLRPLVGDAVTGQYAAAAAIAVAVAVPLQAVN
ncbi:MAG: oligosaccharide flippase family protein, partial [Pirellulales bacterium]|nr:oligosaccharide flippase family protein [Pirellulales bacterium]